MRQVADIKYTTSPQHPGKVGLTFVIGEVDVFGEISDPHEIKFFVSLPVKADELVYYLREASKAITNECNRVMVPTFGGSDETAR